MSVRLIKVGRGSDNDIVLTENQISTHHVEFFMDESGLVFITDMGSKNGTFINGVRLAESAKLKTKDKVRLGSLDVDWMEYFRVKPNVISNSSKKTNSKQKKASGIPMYVYIIMIVVFSFGGIFALNEFILTAEDDQGKSVSSGSSPSSPDASSPSNSDGDSGNEHSEETENVIPKEIEYYYDCLGTDALNEASSLEAELIDMTDISVSVSEEMDIGKELYNQYQADYNFLRGQPLQRCQRILNNLIPHIKNPRDIDYEIYVID